MVLHVNNTIHVIPYLHAILLHASAGFEVGTDTLTSAFLEFWELSAAGLNNGLDLFLRLFGDRHHPVQVLVHEQTHKHLWETKCVKMMLMLFVDHAPSI